jgi:DNA-binding CsgD family transcriptional regulator
MTEGGGQIGADLTPREREVLAMVAAGMTNREIGSALFISESTAGVHVSNLMAKLGVGSRTEAAAVAYRAGLVEMAEVLPPSEADVELAEQEDTLPDGPWSLQDRFRRQVENHPRRIAAIGVGVLAVLFLLSVGLAVAVFGEAPVAGGDATNSPSAEPSPSEEASPSVSADQSPSLLPGETPIGGSDVVLEVDGLAEILVDDLILRAEPGTGTVRLGELPGGATVFVAAGPVVEDGFAWYQLAPVQPFGAGCGSAQPPESLVCRDWFGWAAAGGQDGEAWLASVEPICPAGGSLGGLMALEPLDGLACFGSASMTLRVYMPANPQGGGCAPGDPFTPHWLASCAAARFEQAEVVYAADDGLWVNIAPNLGSCNGHGFGPSCPLTNLQGRWLTLTAQHDHPQSEACSERPVGVPDLQREATILKCRTALAATALVTDDGLGTIDQRQETYAPEFPTGYQPNGNGLGYWAGVAQTFRAGRSGELTAVQLSLNRLQGTQGSLRIELRRDGPNGELVATSADTGWEELPIDSGNCLPPQCLALDRQLAWVIIRFDPDVPTLTAGQTYALVLPRGLNTANSNPTFQLATSTADAYAAGTQWGRGPGPGDTWQSHESGADLAFRTIVR